MKDVVDGISAARMGGQAGRVRHGEVVNRIVEVGSQKRLTDVDVPHPRKTVAVFVGGTAAIRAPRVASAASTARRCGWS